MKTMNMVLLAGMVLAGTSAFAQRNNEDNNRQGRDKQKTEVRSNDKKTDARQADEKENSRAGKKREIVFTDRGRASYTERERGREESENRRDDRRENADNRRYEQQRDRNRRERDNNRYEERRDRDRDHRTMDIRFERSGHRFDACPLCYGPRMRSGYENRYTLADLARIETRRLEMALDLSDRQVDKIYRINLKYLTHRMGNRYNAMERREREIRNVLKWGQLHAYDVYISRMDNHDFCDDCNVGWRDGHFRIAFHINL